MSTACEEPCSWTDYLVETIDKTNHAITNFLSTTFGLTFNPSNVVTFDNESLQRLSEVFHELVGLLSFDDFQLQLLKVFLFTLVSCVALIYVAWHIYGPRISEQFMKSNTPPEHSGASAQ